jgi:cyclic pyranopterin phosphate synthase
MIDITTKPIVKRMAKAEGRIFLKKEAISAIKNGTVKKGDVLGVARIAGIMAIKNTASIIPLCHQILVTGIEIKFKINKTNILCICTVTTAYKTGVEMEALVGVSTALLTIWDMVKYIEKDSYGKYPTTKISEIRVIEKNKYNK